MIGAFLGPGKALSHSELPDYRGVFTRSMLCIGSNNNKKADSMVGFSFAKNQRLKIRNVVIDVLDVLAFIELIQHVMQFLEIFLPYFHKIVWNHRGFSDIIIGDV